MYAGPLRTTGPLAGGSTFYGELGSLGGEDFPGRLRAAVPPKTGLVDVEERRTPVEGIQQGPRLGFVVGDGQRCGERLRSVQLSDAAEVLRVGGQQKGKSAARAGRNAGLAKGPSF